MPDWQEFMQVIVLGLPTAGLNSVSMRKQSICFVAVWHAAFFRIRQVKNAAQYEQYCFIFIPS